MFLDRKWSESGPGETTSARLRRRDVGNDAASSVAPRVGRGLRPDRASDDEVVGAHPNRIRGRRRSLVIVGRGAGRTDAWAHEEGRGEPLP